MKRRERPFRRALLFFTLLLAYLPAPASAAFRDLRNFQTNLVWVNQDGGGDFTSGAVAWTPYVWFGRVGLRGELGMSLLKNGFESLFPTFNAETLISFSFLDVVGVEGGGGGHYWLGNGGIMPSATLNFLVLTNLGPIDRLFVGYTRLFSTADVGILRLGLGLRF